MTKTISLSDDAYDALVTVKRPGESFSDVARRLARFVAQDALFDEALRVPVSDAKAEEWKRSIRKARESSRQPRVGSV